MVNKWRWLGLIFLISFLLHAFQIGAAGRTWDEQFKFDLGFQGLQYLTRLETDPKFWQEGLEHPMIGKYIYGLTARLHMHPLLTQNDVTPKIIEDLNNGKYAIHMYGGQTVLVDYDWIGLRLTSALLNSLGVLFTFLLAWELFGSNIALAAAGILMLTPRFLAFGKQVSFESETIAFFMMLVYLFIKFLNNRKWQKSIKWYIVFGIISGILLGIRYNNGFIFLFFLGLCLLAKFWQPKLLLIPLFSILTFIISWPLLWNNPLKYFLLSAGQDAVRPIHASIYYLQSLLYTTPVVILIIFLIGLVIVINKIIKKKDFNSIFLLWWLLSVLIFFSLLSITTGGTRYIYFIHPVISIIAAIGLFKLVSLLKVSKYYLLIPLLVYLVFINFLFHPYYLDYYNEIIGGPKGAIRNKLEFSWWGEGQKEAVVWLDKNAKKDALVSLKVTPLYVTPAFRVDLKVKQEIDEKNLTDYLIVSYTDENKISKTLKKKYKLIYSANVLDAPLVSVYEKNNYK